MRESTTFLLIRHGMCAPVGNRITGRLPGVDLDPEGRKQALALPRRLQEFHVDAIYSSPLERTVKTAEPLARALELRINISDPLNEIDFGDWSGLSFEDLKGDPWWSVYNSFRGGIRPPRGELMLEVQTRVVGLLELLRNDHQGQTVALFSHCDVIRALLLHYLGAPLEHILRLEIRPASISVLHLGDSGPQIARVNDIRGDTHDPDQVLP